MTAHRLGWLDAGSGVAGDMLLGALHQLGVLDDLPEILAGIPGLSVRVQFGEVTRGGLGGRAVTVQAEGPQPQRRLDEVCDLIGTAPLEAAVADRATAVFRRLAAAEAAVHGCSIDEVHFHEVGAADAVVDVLGACLGLHRLALDRLVVSPIRLGSGTVSTGHGRLPVPAPAVLALLAGTDLVVVGGGGAELATPTGVAVVAEWADASGDLPEMAIEGVGVGAGSRDLPDRANLLRLVVGTGEAATRWQVVEANVDDLDPRLWPDALSALLAAGAADAWLTPVLMKKGRPAHTVHALLPPDRRDTVFEALVRHTTTIGIRWYDVRKYPLDRSVRCVEVAGQQIRVKLASLHGEVVSATPEWEDVHRAAQIIGWPAKRVLAQANRAAARFLG